MEAHFPYTDSRLDHIDYSSIEKANKDYEGVYSKLVNLVAQTMRDRAVYMNREEDLGDPGLRHSKQSYRPCKMIEKNQIRITKKYCRTANNNYCISDKFVLLFMSIEKLKKLTVTGTLHTHRPCLIFLGNFNRNFLWSPICCFGGDGYEKSNRTDSFI